MTDFPEKCLVDTNVPKTANLAIAIGQVSDDLLTCVWACVMAVEHIVKNGGLVMDSGDEIYGEYMRNLAMAGQPGVGDQFMKWVHDNRWRFPNEDRVKITRNGESYDEFPEHDELADFDNLDRKFIAVANAHPNKPPILQATDSKWWGWQGALAESGITVQFLCPDYVQAKFEEKMGS